MLDEIDNSCERVATTTRDEQDSGTKAEGPVDSRHSSLFEFLVAPRLDTLAFDERFEQLSEFVDDLMRRKHYHYRRVRTSSSAGLAGLLDRDSGRVVEVINLASNDYLDLSRHPACIAASVAATQRYGAGTSASPAAIGNTDLHEQLEREIADFTNCEAALLYSSGFGMNCGVLSALLRREDLAIMDSCVHASIVEGCRGTPMRFFVHNDLEALERILVRSRGQFVNRLVVVEGVYSMDGDLAPLADIVALARRHGAMLMLDEAHSTGVFGAQGRGTAEHFDILGQVDIVAGTFSKSLGSVGGFVAGSSRLIRYLQMASRHYVFSAAVLPSVAASVLEALRILKDEPSIRERLWRNVEYFRRGLLALGFDIGASASAIFPVMVRDDLKVKALCSCLYDDGIVVTPVVFPGVPEKQSRIRLSVTSGLELTQMDYVLERLAHHGKALQII